MAISAVLTLAPGYGRAGQPNRRAARSDRYPQPQKGGSVDLLRGRACMRRRVVALIALAAVLAAATASTAIATGTPRTTTGSLLSYSRAGRLVVKLRRSRQSFTVNHTTTCGVDHGQSGGPIRCGSLRNRKYSGKPVRVTWTKRASKNVASVVVVTTR